jgi:hypothetical protein
MFYVNTFCNLGVVAFMDYKIKNDQLVLDIIKLLIKLGAKVENTFNHKVITKNL